MNALNMYDLFDLELVKALNCWEIYKTESSVGFRLNRSKHEKLISTIQERRLLDDIVTNKSCTCAWDGKQVETHHASGVTSQSESHSLFFLPFSNAACVAYNLTLDKIFQKIEADEADHSLQYQIHFKPKDVPHDSLDIRINCIFNWLLFYTWNQLNKIEHTIDVDELGALEIYQIKPYVLKVRHNSLHLGTYSLNQFQEEASYPNNPSGLLNGLLELKRSGFCALVGIALQQIPDDWLENPIFLEKLGHWYGNEWSILSESALGE